MKGWKTLLLSATLLGGALATAQSAIFEEPNAAVTASFYRGDPVGGGTLLETMTVNNSPVAAVHEKIAGHTFVTLTFEGESYTVATFPGGTDKFGVLLNPSGVAEKSTDYTAVYENATSLAELLDELATDRTALAQLTGSAL